VARLIFRPVYGQYGRQRQVLAKKKKKLYAGRQEKVLQNGRALSLDTPRDSRITKHALHICAAKGLRERMPVFLRPERGRTTKKKPPAASLHFAPVLQRKRPTK